MNTLQLHVKRLHPEAKLPVYATDGSGCFDICGLYEVLLTQGTNTVVMDTGLAFQIPEGHVMLVFSRSGDGFKRGLRLANCVGVVDADYRGPLKIALHLDNRQWPAHIRAGDRIAQAMIVPIPRVEMVEAEDLSETARGEGGFGSTGTGMTIKGDGASQLGKLMAEMKQGGPVPFA